MSALITEKVKEYTKKSIILLDEVDSTNNYLKQNADFLMPDTCVIAQKQTAGRGRIGKKFFSPSESGLYLSILLKPESFVPENFTAAAAVAVARAIEAFLNKKAQIKWVNDVYINNKKVCGILCEALFVKDKPQYVIVGIGVNLLKPQNDFDAEIKNIADAVFEKSNVNFNAFAAKVINEFFDAVSNEDFLQEYKERSLLIDKKVTFNDFNQLYEGVVKEIDNDFAIIIDVDGEKKRFKSGEITFVNF